MMILCDFLLDKHSKDQHLNQGFLEVGERRMQRPGVSSASAGSSASRDRLVAAADTTAGDTFDEAAALFQHKVGF